MIARRGFLGAILAAGAAVGSGILMPVRKLWTPNDVVDRILELAAYLDAQPIAEPPHWWVIRTALGGFEGSAQAMRQLKLEGVVTYIDDIKVTAL